MYFNRSVVFKYYFGSYTYYIVTNGELYIWQDEIGTKRVIQQIKHQHFLAPEFGLDAMETQHNIRVLRFGPFCPVLFEPAH
jgi:hypothetical protein